ncbi:MAG: esterase/lipase family protein [Planctomycetota bacterium]|jgi:hypothetical protein
MNPKHLISIAVGITLAVCGHTPAKARTRGGLCECNSNAKSLRTDRQPADHAAATKYPVVIAPDWGHRPEDTHYDCVMAHLRAKGADIFVATYSKRFDGTPDRACELKQFILCLMNETEYGRVWRERHSGERMKVNVIGHSQGCQDSRYMISNLDMGDKVASWTGLAGEALGTPVADRALRFLGRRIRGDFKESVYTLSEEYMQKRFRAPNVEGVYYQSWSAVVHGCHPSWSRRDCRQWKYMCRLGEPNDVWIPVASQEAHPGHRGIQNRLGADRKKTPWGVHHQAFLGPRYYVNPGFDAYQFWTDRLKELKEKGF